MQVDPRSVAIPVTYYVSTYVGKESIGLQGHSVQMGMQPKCWTEWN